nr:hypothetical protein [Tanacetum cinerariifolium]
MSKLWFASQVDVNNKLSRPVTQQYLPKKRESVFAKPDHMIASSSSRNTSKNMPGFSSNDIVHNYYLEEARKKTQERNKNLKSSVMHNASLQNTTKDQKSHTQKPGRQVFTGHRFSPNKTSVVYEKTSPRSDLRWKPTSRIFKYVGLRWILTGKLFDSCTSKVDSEPSHGSNVDIPNIHECKQTLNRRRIVMKRHITPGIPSKSLGMGIRFSTPDFMNSSDSVAGMVSRCSSPILRELSGTSMDKTSSLGVIAEV